MLRVKTLKMTFFFLPKQHPLNLESLPDSRFYTKDHDCIVQVPNGCAPVWCAFKYDYIKKKDYWENPISGHVHQTHPLGLTDETTSFFDGFYEITPIKGLTFVEGESWCPDTNQKIHVEKTDARSVWNPFFQRYDPPCDRDTDFCDSGGINYDLFKESFHRLLDFNMKTFYAVYCKCCKCPHCSEIHEGSCEKMDGYLLKSRN